MQKRILSAAAITAAATISLAGCSKGDVQNAVNKGKDAASHAANSDAGKKAIAKAKEKASAMAHGSAGASASASAMASSGAAQGAGQGGTVVTLGKFAKNPKAKAAGAYFKHKRAGKPGTFEVNVVGVKANKVSVCVGTKGKRARTVVVRKRKVASVRKSKQHCK